MNHKPKFKHDCDGCLFLGHMTLTFEGIEGRAADLYSCNQKFGTGVIARYSDEPSDNSSWDLDAPTSNPYIAVAQCRERQRVQGSTF